MHTPIAIITKSKDDPKLFFRYDSGGTLFETSYVQLNNSDKTELNNEITAILNQLLMKLSYNV